jgi:hypothetical protein
LIGLQKAAVEAAMKYEWSNGQVEGQINRLKMVKTTILPMNGVSGEPLYQRIDHCD